MIVIIINKNQGDKRNKERKKPQNIFPSTGVSLFHWIFFLCVCVCTVRGKFFGGNTLTCGFYEPIPSKTKQKK